MKQSQHNIEKYLELFKAPGTFLEIGCWDGKIISQTYWLEKEKGWSGLCVDPFPRNFEGRSCLLCSKAVSADGEPRQFTKVSNDRRDGGDVSYFSGFISSIQTHWGLIEEFCNYEILNIETITFDQLFKEYDLPKHIEFLSIDTEGSELEIFKTIDFDKYSFDLIVFEHNENEATRVEVGKILTDAGYLFIEGLRCDDIYGSHKIKDIE